MNKMLKEDSEGAQTLIEAALREYNYPANPLNAARAGWYAARLHAAVLRELEAKEAKREKEEKEQGKALSKKYPVLYDLIKAKLKGKGN
jgi:hypothetical protein